ncbi:MAG: hypothetical protein F2667_08205 [Actinobacteria bacterium]|nr:hypothetical protein [Actinomycetota bacterium]
MFAAACPCGAASYDDCCGPLHRGAAGAETAEQLMRSRYAAYARHDEAYVFRTWHPRTRPDDLTPDPARVWLGLRVLDHGVDWVEFVASYEHHGHPGQLHERSRFEQRAGRWVYVDGDDVSGLSDRP